MAFQGYFIRVKDKKIVEFIEGEADWSRDLIPVSETEYKLAYAVRGNLSEALNLLMRMKAKVEEWEDHNA